MDFVQMVDASVNIGRIQKIWRGYRTRREALGFVLSADHRGALLHTESVPEETQSFSSEETDQEDEDDEQYGEDVSAVLSPKVRQARHRLNRKVDQAASRWYLAFDKICKIRQKVEVQDYSQALNINSNYLLLEPHQWIESLDTKHRYGGNLVFYYDIWSTSDTKESFFYWLDHGEGKHIDSQDMPREKLELMQVKYCNPKERVKYEVKVVNGLLRYKMDEKLLHRAEGMDKLIFVFGPNFKLYVNEKKSGYFHHSSFLSGGITLAAGSMDITHGRLISVNPHSGHYRPTEEDFARTISLLTETGIQMENVKLGKIKAKKKRRKKTEQ